MYINKPILVLHKPTATPQYALRHVYHGSVKLSVSTHLLPIYSNVTWIFHHDNIATCAHSIHRLSGREKDEGRWSKTVNPIIVPKSFPKPHSFFVSGFPEMTLIRVHCSFLFISQLISSPYSDTGLLKHE